MSVTLIRRLLLGLVVLSLLGAGIWWAKRPKPIAVQLARIDQGKVESSIANTRAGSVEACMRTRLSTTAGGRISELPVKEGEHVKKGQLLIKLWNDDQLAASNLAQAQVETARKRVAEACTVATNAESEALRQNSLYKQGFVSISADELARANAQSKRATCEAVQAEVNQALAQLSATKVEQSRTALYAPFAGTVAKIVGEVGEYSTPSPPGIQMPPAIDLIDESCLYVSAPMDEVDAPKISRGQDVRVSFDALPKQFFPGKVRRVAPYVTAVEKQARTVDVEVDLDPAKAPARLLVGYSADVEVILAVRDNVVRIPTSALQEGGHVLVAGTDGVLRDKIVKTGLANWEFTEVLEGLAAGDQVVTSLEREGVKAGAAFVADNAAVK